MKSHVSAPPQRRRRTPPQADALPEQLATVFFQIPADHSWKFGERENRSGEPGTCVKRARSRFVHSVSESQTTGNPTERERNWPTAPKPEAPDHSAYRLMKSVNKPRRLVMEIKGRRRRKSQLCEGCGEVRDLVGEYPDGAMLCDPCNGRLTCRCCGLPDGEYRGRAHEYGGDPDEYVCPQCRDGCSYDKPGGGCQFLKEQVIAAAPRPRGR